MRLSYRCRVAIERMPPGTSRGIRSLFGSTCIVAALLHKCPLSGQAYHGQSIPARSLSRGRRESGGQARAKGHGLRRLSHNLSGGPEYCRDLCESPFTVNGLLLFPYPVYKGEPLFYNLIRHLSRSVAVLSSEGG